jgi:hypothetical protein
MKVRSALRRLAVTAPFFLTAIAVLRMVAGPLDVASEHAAPLVLIVTTERLHPAFRALELWNETQGCRARVVTLRGQYFDGTVTPRLAALCREEGATGVLLGGAEDLVPLLGGTRTSSYLSLPEGKAPRVVAVPMPAPQSMPTGILVGRAPVRDLEEAWAFVEACRTSGRTLDQLIAAPVAGHDADPGANRGVTLAQAIVSAGEHR